MDVYYRRLAGTDADLLTEFLTSEPWPFHAGAASPDRIRRKFDDGYYDNAETRTFWMITHTEVGLIRLMDLSREMPTIDLRIRSAHRGKGLGAHGVRWLTTYLFTQRPGSHRLEGTTRQDNYAMRRTLTKCGWVEHARYRQSWPGEGDVLHDAVGYAILRANWESGSWLADPDHAHGPSIDYRRR